MSIDTCMQTIAIDLASSEQLRWEFQPEGEPWRAIQVPAGGWTAQGIRCNGGTYRTSFPIPQEAAGKRVRLEFEAVNYGAEIFAGTDEARLVKVAEHLGGWIPFGADLTDVAQPGERCHLRVEVKGREHFQRGNQSLVPVPAPWFEGLAEGIIRGVRLELLPMVRIENVFVKTSVASGRVEVFATLCNAGNTPAAVDVPVRFSAANTETFQYPAPEPLHITLEPGETRESLVANCAWGLGRESYWWPNVPYQPGYKAVLHQVAVSLTENGKTVHQVEQRFGFREFRAVGNTYQLNGMRCNLRGDNQQEANFGTDAYGLAPGFQPPTPDCAGWPGAVDNLQRLNFNVLRIHQIPATKYMLDVCDEMGLMIVDETPIRGSERGEDHLGGRECRIQTARDLALRDRQHPCVVLWSAANEFFWPDSEEKPALEALARALQAAINDADGTRPVIFDGLEDIGPDIINMRHYVGEPGTFPRGDEPRADRPYGETESIWPVDNSPMGFAWIGTSTRVRRLTGNADIRNYVFNNAWPNYVPGQSRNNQFLELKIKGMEWPQVAVIPKEIMPDIAEPWRHPNIRLLQQSFHPLAVWDVEFDQANQYSDHEGAWPVIEPPLPAGALISRPLAVFNDEFAGEEITVEWEVRGEETQLSGTTSLRVPCGEHRICYAHFLVPTKGSRFQWIVKARKAGELRFEEDRMYFRILPAKC